MIPTGFQIQQGRQIINMSQADLAAAVSVGLAVVIRAELAAHILMLTRRDAKAIKGVLEASGVEFIPENGGGAGVRLRKGES